MEVLKNVGYLVAAIAVLTALVFGGLFIAIISIVIGILLKVILATFFTATAIKVYFEKKD